MLLPPSRRRPSHGSTSGFTMGEVLVGSIIGLALLASVSRILIAATRTSTINMQSVQRRSDWNKLTDLISTESSEGSQFLIGATMSAPCPATTSLFTIQVPVLNTAGTARVVRSIHYYQTGSGVNSVLRRCGPAVTATGTLDTNPANDADVAVIEGIPIMVSTPTDCTQCLEVNSNFPTAEENNLFSAVLLTPGVFEISRSHRFPGPLALAIPPRLHRTGTRLPLPSVSAV